MSEQRFDRLENTLDKLTSKVDKMTDVITSLARIEEKHVAVQQRLDHHDSRMNKHSASIDSLNLKQAATIHKSQFNEWFIRAVIVAMVTGVAFMMRG